MTASFKTGSRELNLTFLPIDEENARIVLSWRYSGKYAFYNSQPEHFDEELQTLTNPDNYYFAVTSDQGTLVACFCFGKEAQVPGGDYSAEALDYGCGMRPDLTGLGLGTAFILAGQEFGARAFDAISFRVTVAAFNRRAIKACTKAGFNIQQKFNHALNDSEYVVLVKVNERSRDGKREITEHTEITEKAGIGT